MNICSAGDIIVITDMLPVHGALVERMIKIDMDAHTAVGGFQVRHSADDLIVRIVNSAKSTCALVSCRLHSLVYGSSSHKFIPTCGQTQELCLVEVLSNSSEVSSTKCVIEPMIIKL